MQMRQSSLQNRLLFPKSKHLGIQRSNPRMEPRNLEVQQSQAVIHHILDPPMLPTFGSTTIATSRLLRRLGNLKLWRSCRRKFYIDLVMKSIARLN